MNATVRRDIRIVVAKGDPRLEGNRIRHRGVEPGAPVAPSRIFDGEGAARRRSAGLPAPSGERSARDVKSADLTGSIDGVAEAVSPCRTGETYRAHLEAARSERVDTRRNSVLANRRRPPFPRHGHWGPVLAVVMSRCSSPGGCLYGVVKPREAQVLALERGRAGGRGAWRR